MAAVVNALARQSSDQQAILMHAYECYAGPLKAFMLRTVNEADAEDLVQDVYLRMARHRGLGAVENLQAFLYTTATNLLRDRWRRANALHAPLLVDCEDCVLVATAADPAEVIHWRERLLCVQTEFERLPEQTRLAFELNRSGGLTYVQIAKILEVSVSMIEKHVAAALRLLRKVV